MASVKDEIDRIVTAKENLELAIEYCGVDVPSTASISDYDDYVMAIPTAVLSHLDLAEVGGTNKYIKSISQTNGVISASAGNTTSTVTENSAALITSGGVYNEVIKYLPLSGGTISNTAFCPLVIERSDSTNTAALRFKNKNGILGSIGMNAVYGNLLLHNAAGSAYKTILDSVNYSNYALPLSGGKMTGPIVFNGTDSDRYLIRVNNGSYDYDKVSAYGFTLKYLGASYADGIGANNVLALYADNSTNTSQNLSTVWLNNGNVRNRTIEPHTDDTYYLGSSSLKWKNVYAKTFTGNLTGNASSATALTVKSKGSATQPIYWDANGQPVACTYSLNTTVPANAVFTDTNYYPTTFTWTGGTTSGPTGSLTGTGMGAVSFGAIPSAGASVSGIVTTAAQTFAGEKTFNSTIKCSSLTPRTTGYNLGSSSYPFSSGYINNLYIDPYATTSTLYITGLTSNSGTTNLRLYTQSGVKIVSGTQVHATGGFFETSDERLKCFDSDIKVDLDKIAQLPKKYFTWKDGNNENLQIGTSAQAVREIYPELVSEDENRTLSVAYDKLSVVALAAIDKLYTEFKTLRKQNSELEDRISKLEKLLLNGNKY